MHWRYCSLALSSQHGLFESKILKIDPIAHLQGWGMHIFHNIIVWFMTGVLPKGPHLPCLSMAGRALLAGYHRHLLPLQLLQAILCLTKHFISCTQQIIFKVYIEIIMKMNARIFSFGNHVQYSADDYLFCYYQCHFQNYILHISPGWCFVCLASPLS